MSVLGTLEGFPIRKILVAVKSIQLGQVWRQDASGQDYLVTKVYSEVFSQFAVLRPAEVTAPDAPTVKVKVAKSVDGARCPASPLPRKVPSRLFLYTGDGALCGRFQAMRRPGRNLDWMPARQALASIHD